jgi:hypothetical protein
VEATTGRDRRLIWTATTSGAARLDNHGMAALIGVRCLRDAVVAGVRERPTRDQQTIEVSLSKEQ